jgi:hypothetical protein
VANSNPWQKKIPNRCKLNGGRYQKFFLPLNVLACGLLHQHVLYAGQRMPSNFLGVMYIFMLFSLMLNLCDCCIDGDEIGKQQQQHSSYFALGRI